MLSLTKGVRLVCTVAYLLFSILVIAYKATVRHSSKCLSFMFKMLDRKGVVSWRGGLQSCKLNSCKNWTWRSSKHCQVFSSIEWSRCFLGSISTTQLNETSHSKTHSFLCFISRKRLCLERETKKGFTFNKRQRKALPWTTLIWWRLFNLSRLLIIATYKDWYLVTCSLTPLVINACSRHVTYAFQSESTLYSCLNFKELLARSRREIWSLSDCNWTRTQNH